MLEKILLKYLDVEASKLADRYHKYHNYEEIKYQRNLKRIANAPKKEVKTPDYWVIDKKFNPFYILKHKKQIAKSIAKKLENGTYEPFPPYKKQIAKQSGGFREVSIYQIPDAVVSKYIYIRLLSKNKHRFSSLAYAYRNDRNVHYAIQDKAYEFNQYPRVFISEFDFSDFFGSISQGYLSQQLNQNGFLISEFEKGIIEKFIKIQPVGIPQGTSISLFLANLVCWKLDRRLENEGLRFARYADDTVVWSNSYSKICKSFDIIYDFSKEAGIDINLKKSDGISLLTREGMPSEFYKTKEHIEFLGYRLSGDKVSVKQSSVNKIKKQISYLLYRNLIQPIKSPKLRALTIPNNGEDEALYTAMMQIRRYLYGNLNEIILKRYINGSYKRLTFKGIMSFYPLVNDVNQLESLDGWLITTVLNALKLRKRILLSRGYRIKNEFPFNLNKNNVLEAFKKKPVKGKIGLIEMPSFLRIYNAIQVGLLNDGIEATMNPRSNQYHYN